jgi:hypothetical protein
MRMEYPHNKRESTNTMVTIAYAPLGIISARMTSLGHNGIHIDTGPICLQIGHNVDIFFRLADGGLLSIKALTTHTSKEGTELCFTDEDAPARLPVLNTRYIA